MIMSFFGGGGSNSGGDKETIRSLSRDLNRSISRTNSITRDMDNSRFSSRFVTGVRRTFVQEKNDHTWENLQRIEKIRRKILRRSETPFFGKVLMTWEGTVSKAFFRDPFSHFLMILYIATRCLFYLDKFSFIQNAKFSIIGVANIGMIGGFLTIFLIFYAKYASERYADMYKASMGCEGRIFDVAALACSSLPRVHGLRLLRYLNAAHIAGYIGLSDTYTYGNFFITSNKTKKLLTSLEQKRMESICMDKGGSCYRELISWAIAEVTKAQKNGLIDNQLAHQYRELILKLRGCIGTLYDFDDQPIEFFYCHFVCVLTFLYLPLFTLEVALSTGYTKDLEFFEMLLYETVSITTVFLQAIFVIGLRILADRVAFPYGCDYEDFSVLHYVNFTWVMSRRMLNAELPAETDLYEEEQMCEEATQSPSMYKCQRRGTTQMSEEATQSSNAEMYRESDDDEENGE